MPDVWILYRAREHPRVGEFASEDAAQNFADYHGLIDWQPLQVECAVSLFDGQEHKAVCSACEEKWPCRVQRLEHEARRIAVQGRNRCAKCDKDVGWTGVKVPGGGLLGENVVYCGRAGSACRKTGLAELLRLGRRDLYDKAEAERAQRAEALARRKAEKATQRRVWEAGAAALSRERS